MRRLRRCLGESGDEMDDTVWLLWFEQARDTGEDTEPFIGAYRTEQNAKLAVARLKDQPGFKDYPEGFHVYEHTLDRDGRTEGFVRV